MHDINGCLVLILMDDDEGCLSLCITILLPAVPSLLPCTGIVYDSIVQAEICASIP